MVSKNEGTVKFCITVGEVGKEPAYGIEVIHNNAVCEKMENIFFTKEEAEKRCRWLTENNVSPEIFKDIMADILL